MVFQTMLREIFYISKLKFEIYLCNHVYRELEI